MNEGSFAKISENIVGSIYRELMYATYGTGLAVMELSMLLEEEIYSRSHSQISDNQYSIWKNEGAVKFYGDLAARVVRNINRIQLSADEWRIHYEKRDIKNLEKKFNKKVVTYSRQFKKFYKAEARHQNFYKVYFENYLKYKKACQREEILNEIWDK